MNSPILVYIGVFRKYITWEDHVLDEVHTPPILTAYDLVIKLNFEYDWYKMHNSVMDRAFNSSFDDKALKKFLKRMEGVPELFLFHELLYKFHFRGKSDWDELLLIA